MGYSHLVHWYMAQHYTVNQLARRVVKFFSNSLSVSHSNSPKGPRGAPCFRYTCSMWATRHPFLVEGAYSSVAIPKGIIPRTLS